MKLSLKYSGHPTAEFAARELRDHFALLPEEGPLLEIALSISGDSPADAYQVAVGPNGGEISGSNPRSLLLGVYDYLRHIGFRFLHPGKSGTYIPEKVTTEDLIQNFIGNPQMFHRGICIEGADSLENVLDMIQWLPKAGFSAFFIQFKEPYFFLERWYDHVKNDFLPPEHKPDAFYQDCYRQIFESCRIRDLLVHSVGHGFTAEALGYPSIGWIPAETPPDAEIRKLIALVDGKRELVDNLPLNTNLCYSDPTARKRLLDAVVAYARQHPDIAYLHVWLADDYNHICECEACRKTTPTDQYISLLNELDEKLTEEDIPCKIVFLLYQELLYPPETESLKHPERFVLMFAPISRTFEYSYPEQPQERTIPPYIRNHMQLPVDIHENLSYLKAWQNVFHGDSFVYDYPLGKAHYGDFGYLRISKTLFADIRKLPDLHLNGYMSCQELRAAFPTGLPNYVMGRCLTDPQVSFETLVTEYFAAAFGQQYPTALKYLQEVSRLSSMDYFIGIGPRQDAAVAQKYQDLINFTAGEKEKLAAIQSSLSESPNAKMQRKHWELLVLHTDYCRLLATACKLLAEGDPGAEAAYAEFTRFVQSTELSTQAFLDTYRIQEVTGKYTGF